MNLDRVSIDAARLADMDPARCPNCKTGRPAHRFLCAECFDRLPAPSQQALAYSGPDDALRQYGQLLRAIRQGTALAQVVIR